MKRKCLIVDPMHESIFDMLKEIGWHAEYHPDITRDEIKQAHVNFDGLIVRSKTTIDRDLLGEHPTVRFIGRAGAGLDNLDVFYLKEKKIHVVHAAEGNRDAVGEFTVGLLLSLLRNIVRADNEVRNNIWHREENRGEELMGKTVGLIGYGNMGKATAQKLSAFGCKILAYDKYKTGFGTIFCTEATMQEIFEQTDVLSLHIPLTEETRGLVTESYISGFKKNIIIINTARGEIIPLAALASAMQKGKVRGAALDVLENEKIKQLTPQQQQSFNYLKRQPNVIFTPHIAGWTFESHVKINVALVQKIKKLDI